MRQEDAMAFGKPTRYLQLDVSRVEGGPEAWDQAVREASDEYKVSLINPSAFIGTRSLQGRMHNLLWDNCHSHVGKALNLMRYNDSSYNMVKLAAWVFLCAKYTGVAGFLKTWLPFTILVVTLTTFLILF